MTDADELLCDVAERDRDEAEYVLRVVKRLPALSPSTSLDDVADRCRTAVRFAVVVTPPAQPRLGSTAQVAADLALEGHSLTPYLEALVRTIIEREVVRQRTGGSF